jgi:hypothetical protein
MNMISTGTFQEEMDTSKKHEALVTKLVRAWEKKNSKIARAGGVSLMALTLAACGDDDTTPFSQVDVDAAKVTAKAEGVAEGIASVDITSDNAAVAEAARAEGVASVDITTDNAGVIATAVATAEAAKDAAMATLQATYDALVATNATLQASYDALIAPKALVATTATDSLQGGVGNDAFTAAAGTVAATDRFNDTSATDSDTLTIVHATDPGAFTATNIETIDISLNAIGAITLDVANYSGVSSLTVTKGDVSLGGATLTGNKAVTISNYDGVGVASVTVGAGTTTVDIDSGIADAAGGVLNLDTATGAVTFAGASTVNAALSTDVRMDDMGLTTAAETGKATVINAAAALRVDTHADLTGAITVNAAAARDVNINDGQGGVTVTAATAATADAVITVNTTDASGVTIVAGTGADDTTTATNIGLDIAIDGSTATTDTASISAAGHIELDIDGGGAENVDILTLSGNGADVIYDLAAPATGTFVSATKAGTNSVEIMGDASEFTATTITDIDVIDVIGGGGTAFVASNFSNVGKIDFGVDQNNTKITVNSGQTVEITLDQAGAGTDFDFSAAGGGDLTIIAGDDNGTSTAVGTILLGTGVLNAAAAADTTVGTVTIEASIANVDSTGVVLGAKQVLKITGDEDVSLSAIGSAESVTADTVDGSASSGIITINVEDTANVANVDTVITGSGNDAVEADVGTGTIAVTTNDGNDTITISAIGDGATFDGGAGNDTFNVDDASQGVYLGGAGNDSFDTAVTAANIGIGGTIIGGEGTDNLTIDGAIANTAFAATFAMSGIETLDIGAANSIISMTGAQLANNPTLDIVGAGGDDTFNVNTGSTATVAGSADLSNVTNNATTPVNLITVTGGVGVDTMTGGVASETFTQTTGADTVDGGGTTAADTYVLVNNLTDGTSSAASTGSVINLGSTAVTSAAITSAISKYVSGTLTQVDAGKVAYAYDATATTTSAAMDTVSGIENVTGGAGVDYIVGTSGNNVLTGEAGADYISGGAGADTITGGLAADTILLGASDAVSDSVVFTSGLTIDAVSNFETGVDKATFDISSLETAAAVIAGSTHNLIDGDGTDITDASSGVILAIAGAAVTLTQTATVLNYTAATVANAAALETALEVGGGVITTEATTGVTAKDAMLAMYDNGTNIMLAIVEFTSTVANNTKIAAVDVADVASLTGITADLAAGDFAFIA